MKTIISAENEIFNFAAEQIKKLLHEKTEPVLALPGGRTVQGLYALLLDMFKAGELSFSRTKVFALAEFLDSGEHMSCRRIIYDDFLSKTDIKAENVFFPQADCPEDYDRLIADCGGLDLALLGIGENAHIGYNEPATPYASLSHVQKLTEATKRQLSKQFGSGELPERAVTMGIKTITQARQILLIALGEDKAEAVHKMLYGRNDSVVPAAFLQIPLNVNIYLDEAASSQI